MLIVTSSQVIISNLPAAVTHLREATRVTAPAGKTFAGHSRNIFRTNTSPHCRQISDKILKLSGQYSIVGRAIVVHAGEDDLGMGNDSGSLKTGNAGGRVACCTVYTSEEPKQ